MQIIPSWLPPVVAPKNPLGVSALRRIRPAKRAEERASPPLLRRAIRRKNSAAEENANGGRTGQERRQFCRRVSRQAQLRELRGRTDRRRRKGRHGGPGSRIDEKV